ncbi:hypothetical protein [Synechococcus sp. MW101C3]|uniref:hypothetical protein n=1 Tax=Synechococcus sp. MW101C3 TaxID=210768 RepID=UPI0013035286|nr:hypothetical protein [Synechococcus sp. MW101C3]
MNARLALQTIAQRALAQRDADRLRVAQELDAADELNHDGPKLIILIAKLNG